MAAKECGEWGTAVGARRQKQTGSACARLCLDPLITERARESVRVAAFKAFVYFMASRCERPQTLSGSRHIERDKRGTDRGVEGRGRGTDFIQTDKQT